MYSNICLTPLLYNYFTLLSGLTYLLTLSPPRGTTLTIRHPPPWVQAHSTRGDDVDTHTHDLSHRSPRPHKPISHTRNPPQSTPHTGTHAPAVVPISNAAGLRASARMRLEHAWTPRPWQVPRRVGVSWLELLWLVRSSPRVIDGVWHMQFLGVPWSDEGWFGCVSCVRCAD